MIFDWFKSEKPNIYLGSLAVVSEDNIARIENFFSLTGNSLHDHMRTKLEEVFCLNSVTSRSEQKPSDVGLDVVIITLHGGDAFSVDWVTGGIPFFWRPKIKLVSRIYNLKTKKTINSFKVSQSVSWREFFAKQFTFKGMFRFGPLYSNGDMELLLYQACLELVNQMRKVV